MTVNFEDILACWELRLCSTTPALAAYLVLGAADALLDQPSALPLDQLALEPKGALKVGGGRPCSTAEAEARLRDLLSLLMEVGSVTSPALTLAAGASSGDGVKQIVRELEAALIPVNRAAGRRSLARLHRECVRAKGAKKLKAAGAWRRASGRVISESVALAPAPAAAAAADSNPEAAALPRPEVQTECAALETKDVSAECSVAAADGAPAAPSVDVSISAGVAATDGLANELPANDVHVESISAPELAGVLPRAGSANVPISQELRLTATTLTAQIPVNDVPEAYMERPALDHTPVLGSLAVTEVESREHPPVVPQAPAAAPTEVPPTSDEPVGTLLVAAAVNDVPGNRGVAHPSIAQVVVDSEVGVSSRDAMEARPAVPDVSVGVAAPVVEATEASSADRADVAGAPPEPPVVRAPTVPSAAEAEAEAETETETENAEAIENMGPELHAGEAVPEPVLSALPVGDETGELPTESPEPTLGADQVLPEPELSEATSDEGDMDALGESSVPLLGAVEALGTSIEESEPPPVANARRRIAPEYRIRESDLRELLDDFGAGQTRSDLELSLDLKEMAGI